jgi:GT2 family glycosyltransferase
MAKVSIIIPCWGVYKQFLQECLASIDKQTYKDYEVIVVDTETDLPTARNKGIEKATGEYILPLDVDDEIEPNYLEKTVDKGDIVTTGYYHSKGQNIIVEQNVTVDGFKDRNQLIACSLFKKEVWESIDGYDEEMKLGYEDWDFWYRAVKQGYKVTVINEPLYNYKRRSDSMISTTVTHHNELKNYILNK